MSIRSTAIAIVVGAGLLAAPAQATNIFWNNAAGGNWSDPLNWSPRQVPGSSDVAFIGLAGTYTVTLDVSPTINRFSLGSATGTQTLDVTGQTITLNTTFTSSVFAGGVLDLSGGSLVTGTGNINNLATVIVDGSSIDVPVSHSASMTVRSSSALNSTLTTGSSSITNLDANASLTVANGYDSNGTTNLGAASSLIVTTGTLTNTSSGVINASGLNGAIGAEIDNKGILTVFASGVSLNKGSAGHVNSGTIDILSTGGLTVTQTGVSPTFSNHGTLVVDGNLTVTGGTASSAGVGTISGAGTIDVSASSFTNFADVSPGTSPGILGVVGDYTESVVADLNIEIGGLVAGTEHDQLTVSGTAVLAGGLNVSLTGGFVPNVGDTFTILTYGSFTGAFSDTSSLVIGGGLSLVQEAGPTSLTLVTVSSSNLIAPVDPGVCITPFDPCLNIPFEYLRGDATPVRAFTVSFTLSPEIELCDGLNSITEGSYLSGFCGGGCTSFQVNDNGGGSYTVDATILGATCGPTTSGGTLFEIDVTDTGADGTGTITVNSTTVRDCNNAPVPADPGNSLAIDIDVSAPVAPTVSADQITSGNDGDGTTGITVTLSAEAGHTIEVFRKGYGDYPEYDDGTGSVPTVPTDPADALANGWTLTAINGSGQVDEPATRDYYYYVMFQTSQCGLISPPSVMTDGTLNYHLGDVSDGLTNCEGDNMVGVIDVSFLGANYFKTGVDVDPVNCLDCGPTDDFSPDGLPTTDDAINFEDLVLIGINFSTVSREVQPADDGEQPDNPMLTFEVDRASALEPNVVTARLILTGNTSTVKGIHSRVAYETGALKLVDVSAGRLLDDQSSTPFFAHLDEEGGVWVDTAVMGRNVTFEGSGEVAVLRFRAEKGASAPTLALADLRDLENRFLQDGRDENGQPDLSDPPVRVEIPGATRLLAAHPNPFIGSTNVPFSLADDAAVTLRVYDVAGRLVRTLANDVFSAGLHSVVWDGANERGQALSSGVYLYTLNADGVVQSRKLFLRR